MILLTPYKHYYEQIDGKTIDITDEIPFDLPDSWAWCRLGILCKIKGGKRVPKGDDLLDEPTPYVYLRVTDMKAGTICDFKKKYISEETFKKIANYTISKDDVYLTIAGTIGLVGFIPEKYDGMSLTENAAKLTNISINKLFLGKILTAGYFQNIFNEKRTQVAQPKLALERVATVLFPLPPLAEQQRIVEQVETLLKYVDIIDSDAETLDKSITLAKQKILDLAIRGKLVQQDPTDEPASELLKKIKAEKDALVKAGKIKKDKHESFIFKGDDNCYYEQFGNEQRIIDNISFEIPDNWAWCHLEDTALLLMGQSPAGNSVSEGECGIEFHQGKIYFSDRFLLQSPQRTTEPTRIAPANSVLICVRAPVGTVNITLRYICIGRGLASATPLAGISTDFLFYLLNARKSALVEQATGSTFISVTREQIKELLIPLPPLPEQEKIVSYIKQYETILKSIQE